MRQVIEPTLTARDIVLRQDSESTADFIETNGGLHFPIVRIFDTVIELGDIERFKLIVGETFLPRVVVKFSDSQYLFRNTHLQDGVNLMTVFVGNPQDTTYNHIKSDYIITKVSSQAGGEMVTVEGVLFVPNLYNKNPQGFEMTSLEVLQEVARECELGFVTNVNQTNDSMKWLRISDNKDFIKYVTNHAYADKNNCFFSFVDQFANLCFVDKTIAYNSTNTNVLRSAMFDGTLFENPQKIVLTNDKLDSDDQRLQIQTFTPITDYGRKAVTRSEKIDVNVIMDDNQTVMVNNLSEMQELPQQLTEIKAISKRSSINAFSEYTIAPYINKHNQALYQTIGLKCETDYHIPALFMFGVFDVEIFIPKMKTEKDSQDSNLSLDDLNELEPLAPSGVQSLNESLSGECVLTGMKILYEKDLYMKNLLIFTIKNN